jgi:hypothetical protein
MENEQFWQSLERNLPNVFPRKAVPNLTGGFLSAGTMGNLDSQGKGPAVKVRVGKYVGYEKVSFLTWLKGREKSSV